MTTPTTPPAMSAEQRARGQQASRDMAEARKGIKTDVKTGALSVPEVLADAKLDKIHRRMKVNQVLRAAPKVGTVRAKEILEAAGVDWNARLDQLGDHQIAKINAFFTSASTSG